MEELALAIRELAKAVQTYNKLFKDRGDKADEKFEERMGLSKKREERLEKTAASRYY